MNKPIIIDGVDVSMCEDLTNQLCCEQYLDGECEGQDCYYKQLQRLKVEKEKLKTWLKEERANNDKLNQLYQDEHCEVLELKAENEELKEEYKQFQHISVEEVHRLRKALVEIEEICKKNCENCTEYKDCKSIFFECQIAKIDCILSIINEVLK